jgi:hypothetical protein
MEYFTIEAHLVLLPFLFVRREGLKLILQQEKYELLFLPSYNRKISTLKSTGGKEIENMTCHGWCNWK